MLTYDGERGLSLVGTPEYMPPEIILGKGQSFVVDYWMLGILIYNLYYGYTPFVDDNIERIYEKILYTNVNFDSAVKMIAKSNDRHLLPKRWAKKYRMEWKNRMSLPKKDVP